MSFPRYSDYKDSGVMWLGEVPEHWDSWKVSHSFLAIGSGTTPNSDSSEWYDGSIPWVTTGELRENVIGDTLKKVTEYALKKFSALRIHPAGSLAIAMYGATIGRLGIFGIDATTNQACCVLSNPTTITTRFMFYWFLGHKEYIIGLYASGGGQPNINQDIIRGLRIPVPSIEDQDTITAFLDRETAKIDALVAEQERLIELLKEKRQAVISHAVTKGLDPNVPMKDSGLEWLGDMPEHWNIIKVSHLFSAKKGSNAAQLTKEYCADIDGEHPVYSGQTDNNGVMACINEYEFDTGIEGVILSTTVGAKAMSVSHINGKFSLSQNCMIIISKSKNASIRFFYYHFHPLFKYERDMIPCHMQPSFRMEDLYGYFVALPPLAEQDKICAHLDSHTAKIDELVLESEKAIILLKERRSALISAAVTGKIDVRGLADATQ